MARQLKKSSERAIGINVSLPDWIVQNCEILARHGDSTRSRFIRACINFALFYGVRNTSRALKFIGEWGDDDCFVIQHSGKYIEEEDNENG